MDIINQVGQRSNCVYLW